MAAAFVDTALGTGRESPPRIDFKGSHAWSRTDGLRHRHSFRLPWRIATAPTPSSYNSALASTVILHVVGDDRDLVRIALCSQALMEFLHVRTAGGGAACSHVQRFARSSPPDLDMPLAGPAPLSSSSGATPNCAAGLAAVEQAQFRRLGRQERGVAGHTPGIARSNSCRRASSGCSPMCRQIVATRAVTCLLSSRIAASRASTTARCSRNSLRVSTGVDQAASSLVEVAEHGSQLETGRSGLELRHLPQFRQHGDIHPVILAGPSEHFGKVPCPQRIDLHPRKAGIAQASGSRPVGSSITRSILVSRS